MRNRVWHNPCVPQEIDLFEGAVYPTDPYRPWEQVGIMIDPTGIDQINEGQSVIVESAAPALGMQMSLF